MDLDRGEPGSIPLGLPGWSLLNVVADPRLGLQELTHLAALVSMFLGFLGPIVDSTERMFRISKDLRSEVVGLGHRLIQLTAFGLGTAPRTHV